MPLLSKVRRVHQALAIRRKIRPGLPGSFFVMDLVRFGAGLGLHAPESAGAVDVPPVGNEENLITIARPDWTDFVIELAVVITWQIAGSLSSHSAQSEPAIEYTSERESAVQAAELGPVVSWGRYISR